MPSLTLGELTRALGDAELRGDPQLEITGLAYDSRTVEPGTLFFCVLGKRHDGHRFARDARERGAAAVVVQHPIPLEVPQVIVADPRAAMAPIASRFFGAPSRELRMAAVTGTNGKTTTSYMLRTILERAGAQTGLVGTIKHVIGGVDGDAVLTTPEAIDLEADLRAMVAGGDRACVIELSSHGLALRRADTLQIEVAAFTNLSLEHLDFHADMDEYFAAKRQLFVPQDGLAPQTSVVNADDEYGRRLASEIDCLTYSLSGHDADLRGADVSFDAHGSRFRCLNGGSEATVEISLPGDFNADNALCAIAMAAAMGIEIGFAAEALRYVDEIPGRLQRIDGGQPFTVIVDYAHTPSALESALSLARQLSAGRVISVFGCRGNRDPHKRPLMGEIARRLADVCILTSDSPNSEDPGAIIEQILAGVEGTHSSGNGWKPAEIRVEPDRAAAIAEAIGEAETGDFVLITGRGHEQTQGLGEGRRIALDDRVVAREALERLATRETILA